MLLVVLELYLQNLLLFGPLRVLAFSHLNFREPNGLPDISVIFLFTECTVKGTISYICILVMAIALRFFSKSTTTYSSSDFAIKLMIFLIFVTLLFPLLN